MSALPKSYRVYWFDTERKEVIADFVNAASDEDAITTMRTDRVGLKCEIWDGNRLVAQLEGERRQA